MKAQISNRSRAALALCGLFLSLLIAGSASAQSGTSTVRGTVTDPQDNVIAGATITLTNTETNTSRTQTTTDNGAFVFDLIQPGTYRLEAEATGFKKVVANDVRALISNQTDVPLKLEVGNVSETVTITTGGDVQLNTQDATLGNNFVSEQIIQLPLEARNPISLLTLQPGVTAAGNVTGARSDQSNITLDGVDINEAQTNSIFSPVLRLNSEAIDEFRVVTTNANAEQGRSAGAQISLITRGGTNDWHGALFEYHRNTVTTANDFFNNRSGIERPTLLRNTFGGRLDGPIIKDRFFFMYSYEGRRDASQSAIEGRTVPLPSLGRGEVSFRGCPPGVTPCTSANATTITLTPAQLTSFFPTVGLNPTALAILAGAAARYPANEDGGDGFNTGSFRFNAGTPVRLNAHQLRFDYNLTQNGSQTLFFRGSYQHDTQPVDVDNPQRFPDTPQRTRWYHPYGFATGHTWAINNRMTNSFRYGMTRLAVSDQGDSSADDIFFRFVYEPTIGAYTVSRVTPTHNFTDDLSWTKGNHTAQFGTNIRFIRNRRTDFGVAFGIASTNPLYYASSGNVLINPIRAAGYSIVSNQDDLKAAISAVIGRLSDYSTTFNFDLTGNALQAGSPAFREYATDEYDFYVQDSWKIRPSLTLTYGLRYGLSKPVYETQGYMAAPNIPLGEYLDRRITSAAQGINYTEPIIVNKTDQLYDWDKNNFQPRIGVAWSPNFGDNAFGRLIGRNGRSVIRGGFAMVNDYFGQQLAVTFNAQNELGFSTTQAISANTYNLTTNPGPRFTGIGQSIRTLPGITDPGTLVFPQQRPPDNNRRIESSLDSTLKSPVNYSWNVSYQRELPGGLVFETSYIGRAARNLLAGRDATQPNLNFTDTRSGQTWTQAATILEIARAANTPLSAIGPLPFFENLYAPGSLGDIFFGDSSLSNTQAAYGMAAVNAPGCSSVGGCYEFGNDWTSVQNLLDLFTDNQYFYQPQYGALAVYSTIASSDYHAGTLSIRHRLRNTLTLDFNYTLSKSMDDVSGLQTSAPFTPFFLDATNIKQQRSVSDFDVRHIINANGIWQLPFGRNRAFLSDSGGVVNSLLGGWQMSGIFRWNSG
ncbi:MAG TPA: TonB-dependent receptor, partial [Pyrinomonadaceae bacterium]|nr:TonB-dependent receptor [Pyrinomonadaceae bacterium]